MGVRGETADYLQLLDKGADPSDVGEIARNGNDIKAKDGTGVFNLRSGAGLTADAHKTLRQLIHFLDEGPGEGFTSGAYKEVLPSGDPFPTSIIWWESSSKSKKIVEKTITRTGGGTKVKPTPIVWKIYDTDGTTVLWTVSDAITYNGIVEESRTRTITSGS